MISILVSVMRTLFTICEIDGEAYFTPYITGRWWAGINFILIGVPFIAGANIFWFWFFKGEGGRKWIILPIKDYQKPLPDSIVLTIDQVITVLPKATLELEILEPCKGDRDEMFVTLPLGGTADRLYLWHEPAA